MSEQKLFDLLSKYYYDEKYSLYLHHSAKNLFDRLNEIAGAEVKKRKGRKNTKIKIIQNFLQQQRNYTLYRNSKKPAVRNSYRVWSIDSLWEIDLAALPQLAKANNNINFLLVCIDVFSRFAFVRPIKSKQPHEIVKALNDIFLTTNRKPYKIQSDAGKEFLGKVMQNFLEHENIRFRIVRTTLPAKASVVERFNRTLKERIFRYLNWRHDSNHPNELRYIDALQMIVDDYNRTKHTSLGQLRPIEVTRKNAVQVYSMSRERIEKQIKKYAKQNVNNERKFQIGDFVRVQRKRELFEKSSKSIWSDDIFQIKRVIRRVPFPMYEIMDLNGYVVLGKMYARELQKVGVSSDAPIKILQHPSIFSKDKTFKVQSIAGHVQNVDLKKEKELRRRDNYSDFVSALLKNKKKK